MARTDGKTILSIVFKKGVADENRLPLSHVITALQEIEQMVREVGREIQREAGIENPEGDFGIELIAGRGLAFRKGSVATAAAITRDVEHGVQAVGKILEIADKLEKKKPLSIDEYGEGVLRHLPRLGDLQEKDHTELHLVLKQDSRVLKRTKWGEKGRETLRSLEVPELEVHAVTLYGKLRTLVDHSTTDRQTGHFWGQLLEDNGEKWRVRFNDSDQDKVLQLFRKQVVVEGDATYFKTKPPRIDPSDIREDPTPDYVAGFDHFQKVYADIFQDKEPEDILKNIRE